MKRACEYFYWRDFTEEVLEYMFPNAEHINLKEEGNYDFSVDVEDEDGEVVNYSSDEIGEKWNMVDDMESEVYDLHTDNLGIWVVYDRGVDL